MTLEEKVGQMCVPIMEADRVPPHIEKCIVEYGVGMIRYCPNAAFDNASVPIGSPNRYFTASQTATFMNELQGLAQKTRLKIPLFIAVDQEGSTRCDMNRAGAAVYPAHMAFGAADDVELTYQAGKATGREFAAMGINFVQAPIVDVIRFEGRRTIKASSIGEPVEMVCRHAVALMKGYKAGGIAAMAKHFPGYGSIATDAHKGVATITKSAEELEKEDLAPFADVFQEGADGIMMGHVVTRCIDDAVPATLSAKVIKGVIRKKMGFEGIVETDAMRMRAIQDLYGTAQASVMAVQAGCDLVLLRGDMAHFMDGYTAILDAARRGEIVMQDIDDAVGRVLRAKARLGLFDRPCVDAARADVIVGCEEHRQISRMLAEKSVTLLRNGAGVIPIAPKAETKILVVSVEPQKIGAAQDPVQSVDMLIRAVQAEHGRVTGKMLSLNPTPQEIATAVNMAANADVVVVGTCNAILYGRQIELVRALRALGKTLVVVAMESPYDITEFPEVESYVCTYGCAYDAMAAAAKVIFGTLQATGKLPVRMPGFVKG